MAVGVTSDWVTSACIYYTRIFLSASSSPFLLSIQALYWADDLTLTLALTLTVILTPSPANANPKH